MDDYDDPDMPSLSTLKILIDGDNGWPTLPPHQVMALARAYLVVLKRHEKLKDREDVGIDAFYRWLANGKDLIDAFNVMTHRTTLDDRRLPDD